MKKLSLCHKLGGLFLLLALCVLIVGCGGNPVDNLIRDSKALEAEKKAATTDEQKKAVQAKGQELEKRFNALNDDQKKEFLAKMLQEAFSK